MVAQLTAPHSPKRKRFNLRMKSFSLDSPENPSVGTAVGVGQNHHISNSVAPIFAETNSQYHSPMSDECPSPQHQHQHQHQHQQPQQQQQQPQQQYHHLQHGLVQQHQIAPAVGSPRLMQHVTNASVRLDYGEHYTGQQYAAPFVSRLDGHSSATSSNSSSADHLDSYHAQTTPAGTAAPASSLGSNKQQQQQNNLAIYFHPSDRHGTGGSQFSYSLGPNDVPNYDNYRTNHRQLGARGSTGTVGGGGSSLSGELRGGAPLQQHRHSYHNPSSSYMVQYVSTGAQLTTEQQQQQQSRHYDQQHGAAYLGQNHPHQAYHQSAHHHHSQQAIDSRLYSSQLNIHTSSGGGGGGAAAVATSSSSITGDKTNEQHQHRKRLVGSSGQLVGIGCEPSGGASNQAAGGSGSGGGGRGCGGSASGSGAENKHDSSKNSAGQAASKAAPGAAVVVNDEPDYYELEGAEHGAGNNQNKQQRRRHTPPSPVQSQLVNNHQMDLAPTGLNTFVVLYDYLAQHGDEIQLAAGQLVQVLDTSERDWWKICPLDGSQRVGYFPANYLAQLYANERPLQVAQTIQVSNGETCDKLLRGQIVIHTGKQMDNFVTVRTVRPIASATAAAGQASGTVASGVSDEEDRAPQHAINYIQCPEKYLLELGAPQ